MSIASHHSSTAESAPQRFGSLLSKFLAPFAKRFIAGITLPEMLTAIAKLQSQGFLTTADHLGESVASPDEARVAAEQYVLLLKALKERGLDVNISLKLTQMGLNQERELCRENLSRVVDVAEGLGGFVRVDMEGSDVTAATLDIVSQVKKNRSRPVGVVLQAMLKRTPADLVEMLSKGTGLRLCKGAYKEKKDVAWQNMRDIRREYLALAKRLLTSGVYHGIATHDEKLIEEIISFVRAQNIDRASFEFQMLYGVRPTLQKKIIADGFRLRLYVPFGSAWFPYIWRRLRERKENIWFVIKNLWGG